MPTGATSHRVSQRIWARPSEVVCLALLLLIVTATWCTHYHRWTLDSWGVPPVLTADNEWPRWQGAFRGDALWGMASAKATAEGEIGLFSKEPLALGAPFRANWNDWPTTEEALNEWWALLVRLFGLGRGSNLVLLSAHLLAAVSFYLLCRYLGYAKWPSCAGASLFALSRFAFWRGLPHLSLTYYWHVPLALLVVWWCVRERHLLSQRGKVAFCIAVGVLHGIQSIYYSGMFLQLLAGAAVLCAFARRGWRDIAAPIAIGCVVVASAALMNTDTLTYKLRHGANGAAIVRSYTDTQLWALKPLELLLPSSYNIGKIEHLTKEGYYNKALFIGEAGSPYLGIIGICSLLLLSGYAMRAVARNDFDGVPVHFWGIFWIFTYSIVGGITGLIGLWDIFIFRATNRYSIVILAAVLLFFVRQLSRLTFRWRDSRTLALSAAIIALGINDQVPPRQPKQEQATAEMMEGDEKFVAMLEAKLNPGAMVFQLPLMSFPEAAPVFEMTEYEPLRPYLHSHDLRFSYGDDKGRPRLAWQEELAQKDPAQQVALLEKYGFSALLINRSGYEDRAEALLTTLRKMGKNHVLARSGDFICIGLNPSREALSPPEFAEGWYQGEKNGIAVKHWSSGSAVLVLYNSQSGSRRVRLTFGLSASSQRMVAITDNGETLFEDSLESGDLLRSVDVTLTLHPGENVLHFTTDRPGDPPTAGEPRRLAFAVVNFQQRNDATP